MEEVKSIHKELRRLEDVIDSIEIKLHNTTGLLEIIRLGMERLYKEEYTYEIASVCILAEYLSAINDTEITKIQAILAEIKERFRHKQVEKAVIEKEWQGVSYKYSLVIPVNLVKKIVKTDIVYRSA